MTGRLFNTLSYRLKRELQDWRKANSTLRENAWPWYQRALIFAGNRPLRYPFVFFSVRVFKILCQEFTGQYAPAVGPQNESQAATV